MNLPSTHMSLFPQRHENVQGWNGVHARYHEVILFWCARRGLTHACAEDLTQQIWLKLLRDIHSYDPEKGRFRSWLKAVVNNALTDFWRRQQNQPERAGVGGTAFLERLGNFASPEAADDLSGAIEGQVNTSAIEVLARVRSRLQETTWQAFHQMLIEKRAAKDVARDLGISVASVYKNTYRVKQMLQEEYRHVHPDAPGPLPERHDSAAIPSG